MEGALQDDVDFAADTRDFQALLRTQDLEGLISALEGPDLYRLACDDPRYMELAMRGIATLAWDEPAKASELLVHYDTDRLREVSDSPARMAARALMAAIEWRQVESSEVASAEELAPVREFLRLYHGLSGEGPQVEALRNDMRERSEFYATLCEALSLRAQVLPEWIQRLAREEDLLLDEGEVERAADDVTVALGPRLSLFAALLIGLGIFAVFPGALGALAVILCLGVGLALGETRHYEKAVRPRLITLAIEHGVGAEALLSWLYGRGRRPGRLGQFDLKIENDVGLDLLAALARCTSPKAVSAPEA